VELVCEVQRPRDCLPRRIGCFYRPFVKLHETTRCCRCKLVESLSEVITGAFEVPLARTQDC
jgi:hypothetical protein